ncbi:hypothetical protein GCM10012319_61170 [Comamonas sp. KCTC 72670]|nr:hypothetical protein GCM10012319_61170 [Comamonas sp. KCTC 72670]
MLLLGKPYQRHSEERSAFEVEGLMGLQRCQLSGLLCGADLHLPENPRSLRRDDLHRHSVTMAERGPQCLVTAHESLEAPLENVRVQQSFHPKHGGHVVGRTPRSHTVQQPEPLLRKRRRQHQAAIRTRLQRGRNHTAAGADNPIHTFRERSQGGCFEQLAQWQFNPERASDSRHRLGCQQRVATQLEEVVRQADALDTEHLRVDRRQQFFSGCARGFVAGTCCAFA